MIGRFAGPLCATFLLSPVVSAQEDHLPQQNDASQQRVVQRPVELVLALEAAEARVAEPITLQLRVDAPRGTSVIFPSWGPALGELSVIDSATAGELPLQGKTSMRQWLATVRLESLHAGERQIPPLEVRFTLPDEFADAVESTAGVLRTRPMTIHIRSVLDDREDPSRFRDIKGATPLPQHGEQRSRRHAWWAGATLMLGAALGLWWARRRRRPPAAKAWALDQIALLQSQHEAKAIPVGETYEKLSSVIRAFLQDQWSIPATSLSSQELWRELQRVSCPESALASLKQFMAEADERKFSGEAPLSRGLGASTFDTLRAIVVESSRDQASRGQASRGQAPGSKQESP